MYVGFVMIFAQKAKIPSKPVLLFFITGVNTPEYNISHLRCLTALTMGIYF